MPTKHMTIEGVLADLDIDHKTHAEIVGTSFNGNGDLVISVRDKGE